MMAGGRAALADNGEQGEGRKQWGYGQSGIYRWTGDCGTNQNASFVRLSWDAVSRVKASQCSAHLVSLRPLLVVLRVLLSPPSRPVLAARGGAKRVGGERVLLHRHLYRGAHRIG